MTIDYNGEKAAPEPVSSVVAQFLRRSLSIADIFKRALRGWLFGLIGLVAGLAFGVYSLAITPPTYTVSIGLLPTDSSGEISLGGESGGAFGAIASMIGISSSGPVPKFTRFVASLFSTGAARVMDQKYDMICRTYRSDCDIKTHTWRKHTGFDAWVQQTIASVAHLPDPDRPRTAVDLAAYTEGAVVMTSDKLTHILTLTMDSSDPKFASEYLLALVNSTNEYLKQDDRSKIQPYVDYLNRKLATALNVTQRDALSGLLLEQERRLMLSSVDVPYAASIQDGPNVTSSNSAQRMLIVDAFIGMILGFASSMIFSLWANRRRAREIGLATLVDVLEGRLRRSLAVIEPYRTRLLDIAERPLSLDQYLIYSTVLSAFLIVFWMHKGVDIFLGYPIVVVNTAILFAQNRLLIHRDHALIVLAMTVLSFLASANSATPGLAIIAQVIGILLFSTYFFSMLTNSGLTVPRWVQIYCQFALAIVILGFVIFILRQLHLMPRGREGRLRSIYPEPSLFVYVTLPAFGIYANAYLRERRHKLELWIFILAYILADSALGFLGMLLMAFFALLPRLSFWRMMGFGVAAFTALVGLFFISENFRIRVVETVFGMVNLSLNVNASSFAFLSNLYVSIQTFLSHPLFGVGLGGYQYAYTKYIPALSADLYNPDLISLNMFDAGSLYFRTAAELGLVGLIALVGFLVICSRVKGDQHVDIRNALMPYFLVRMSRYGAWFSLELYFFMGLFVLNYLHSRAQYGGKPAMPSPPTAAAPI